MANATTTIAGDIQLAGDLTGTATSPVLANTSVVAGSYTLADITVDSKGRITAAANGSVPQASSSVTGVVRLAGDLTGSASAPVLTTTGVTAGSYTLTSLTVDAKGRITAASTGSVPQATSSVSGTIKLAGDLTGTAAAPALVDTGVVAGSYSSANITVDSKGRVTAAANGISTLPEASYTTKGILSVNTGNGLSITSGVLSGVLANSGTYGVVRTVDSAITITNGTISLGSSIPRLNQSNTFTGAIRTTTSTLTSATNIAVNASLSNVFTLTLAHNATLANASNLGPGRFTFLIKQDGIGGRTLAYGTQYKFPNGHDTAISSTANSTSVLRCISDGTSFYCTLAKGFA